MTSFFIRRPIFAGVVALLMVVAGAISLPLLPIEPYPEVTPPTVVVRANYPGADADTLVDSVTSPIEQAINGVDEMLYIKSTSSDSGQVTITVTFAIGADPDMAAVQVQNRVAQIESRLPEVVRQNGVTVTKESSSIVLFLSVTSGVVRDAQGEPVLGPDGRPERMYDQQYLSNYATLFLRDELARLDGVGNVQVFGSGDFSMRVWLDPEKMAARQVVVEDVLLALREQNVQVSAGQIGAPPAREQEGFQYTLTTQGRLETAEQFEEIVIRVGEDKRRLHLRDIARVEIGSESYQSFTRMDTSPAAALAVYQSPGSNIVTTSDGVRERLDELSAQLPDGVFVDAAFDFTDFVQASIREVGVTLLIAVLLVILVTYIFLQDWRSTLVPTIAIIVSLVGTFALLLAMGFSLNLLSLFGLVLAIGIVVDDAIVVVENCARLIDEGAESPRAAAIDAMRQITGPIIATTLVVLAVFIPAALLPGMTGRLYQQFAVTISIATALSSVNALTLSPALCAILLRKSPERRALPFRAFNAVLGVGRSGYLLVLNQGVRRVAIALLLYLGLSGGAAWVLSRTPTGFLPQEDMGYFFVNVQLPDAAKLSRTDRFLQDIESQIGSLPGVQHTLAIGGFSLLSGTNAPNSASVVVILDPWEDRETFAQSLWGLLGQTHGIVGSRPDAIAFPFAPPAIIGLGNSGGFEYELLDISNSGATALEQASMLLLGQLYQDPRYGMAFTSYTASIPKRQIDIDRSKALSLGVSMPSAFNALQVGMGGAYVNDLNLFGRVYRVYAQNDHAFRESIENVRNLQVRNRDGSMIPLDTFVSFKEVLGPSVITRFNLYPSASINGEAGPGVSSGEAIDGMAELSRSLPSGFGYAWAGATYQEIEAGNVAPIAFGLGLLVVFLVLAAQYESWTIPIAILLAIPFGLLGAVLGLSVLGLSNDIYAQIGLVLLIALVAKNSILLVEFSSKLQQDPPEGSPRLSAREAALEAARLRFRPILMTAFSFIQGVVPLLLATGAGANARRTLGVTVFSGMLVATVVGLAFTPVFYVVIQKLRRRS